MAGLINDEDVRFLRERTNIADVIGDHTALKRAGSRLKGLCPFHDEKTPSFTVDAAQGFFHCFGCDASGDVYAFLQQAEALSFPEAVERLARRMGYTLRYEELSPGQRKALGRRTRLAECMAAAQKFYGDELGTAAGSAARTYLNDRGLSDEHIAHFQLGWAPDAWDALTRGLSKVGFDPQEVMDAGLARQGRHGPMDFFRGRVLFPIFDASGRDVLAFGGRIVPGYQLTTAGHDGSPPKYINSSETELYKKSKTLYGLNWARTEIAKRGSALVVEGYMDVIGLHVAGVTHAVATCGTALTREHFGQLQKFANQVVLALDADQAGFAAAERARELAEAEDIRDVGVLPLPANQDPADLARMGSHAVEEALARTQTSVEFQLVHLLRTSDVSTPEGQTVAYRATFDLLGRLTDRVLRFRYIRDVVAPSVRISADRIEAELDAELPRAAGSAGSVTGHTPTTNRASTMHSSGTQSQTGGGRRDPQMQLERQVLQAALKHPNLMPPAFHQLGDDEFTSIPSRQLFDAMRAAGELSLSKILPYLPDDDTRTRVRALALSEAEFEPEASSLDTLVTDLRARAVQRRINTVEQRLKEVREQLDAEERRSLMKELGQLQLRRHELTRRSQS